MYIYLTAHSAFSLQEGLLSPRDLVQAAGTMGMPALGLTDHNLLTGVVEFATACKEVDIQPIIGLEVNINDGPLTILATSMEGWSNLCRLSSTVAPQENVDAPCSLDTLAAYSRDLIALTSQPSSLRDIFSDRLYVSLQHPRQAHELSNLAQLLGLPTVLSHPIYYFQPEKATLQRTLAAIRLNETIATLPKEATAQDDAHFLSTEEMERRFSDFPDALARTMDIVKRCKFELPIGGSQMPIVPVPPGLTASQHLRQKAIEGAIKLYGEMTPEIQERLDHELEIITRMGFEPIFLIVDS